MAGNRPISQAASQRVAEQKTGATLRRAGPESRGLSRNYDRALYVCENRKLRSGRNDGRKSFLGCADAKRENAKSGGLALSVLSDCFRGAAQRDDSPIYSSH